MSTETASVGVSVFDHDGDEIASYPLGEGFVLHADSALGVVNEANGTIGMHAAGRWGHALVHPKPAAPEQIQIPGLSDKQSSAIAKVLKALTEVGVRNASEFPLAG